MTNWDNPLRGIPDIVEEVLGNVLDCCKKGNVKDYEDVLNNLWTSNMENVSWISKSKYPPMAVLLPRIGVEKVSENHLNSGHTWYSNGIKLFGWQMVWYLNKILKLAP